MRRIARPLLALLGSVCALFAIGAWVNAQTAVTVALPERTILQGETVIIEGTIDCAGFCNQFDITVQYDRAFLRVENAALGGYLGVASDVTMPPNGILFDFASGLVRLSASSTAAAPGDNVLFLLIVTGLRPGVSPLRIISLEVNGANVDPTQVFGIDGTITVRTPPAMLTVTRALEVRSGPNTLFEPIEILQPNVPVEIRGISADGAWFQVALPDGRLGWVVSGGPFIQTNGDLASVPFITTPTPSPSRTPRSSRTPRPTITHTLPPSETPAPTAPPEPQFGYLVATTSANVRDGDGLEYSVISSLPLGQRAIVLGVSSRGTGWYFVQLENDTLGWISPVVVNYNRDVGELPAINPPPLPAAPIIPTIASLPTIETPTIEAPTFEAPTIEPTVGG
ncbi:MAG: SH3 domain-containing protein [Chloroflexota bacterium]|nr:SH3 domain-containing protein [Chloroflexota bacterium]